MSDRKYRHRGYQDDDRESREPRPQRQPGPDGPFRARMEGAPRGRGLGMPGDAVFKCAVCGHRVNGAGTVTAASCCTSCGKPLHTCTNCASFDTGSRFECRKPIPERIQSKAKANQCQLFQPKTVRELGQTEQRGPVDPRAAFDALFKK